MKKKKMAVPKSINESLTDYYKGQVKDVKDSFGLYLKGEPEAIAKKRTVRDNPKAINRLRKQKKNAQKKSVGGVLRTRSIDGIATRGKTRGTQR